MATLNNGLKTIEFNSINWRTIFNDNMQKLDISTINFVLESELPTLTFIEGRLFFATDTVKFYYDDGTQIIEVIASKQIIIGLDTDKLTSTSDQDFFYATDTNILYFNSAGTIISLTGSVDLTAVETDIVPVNAGTLDLGSQSKHFDTLNIERVHLIQNGTSYFQLYRNTVQNRTQMNLQSNFEILANGAYATVVDYLTGVWIFLKDTDFRGFTKLGDLSPNIKVKKISGTTGANQGDTVSELHNLTGSKIISFTLKVEQSVDEGVSSEHTFNSGFQASIHHTDTSFVVSNSAINSGSILSKPFSIYVTYEA